MTVFEEKDVPSRSTFCVVEKATTQVGHPTYSFDMAPYDLLLFQRLKTALKGQTLFLI